MGNEALQVGISVLRLAPFGPSQRLLFHLQKRVDVFGKEPSFPRLKQDLLLIGTGTTVLFFIPVQVLHRGKSSFP